jgi:hypothetical protein
MRKHMGWEDAKDDYVVLDGEKSVGRICKETHGSASALLPAYHQLQRPRLEPKPATASQWDGNAQTNSRGFCPGYFSPSDVTRSLRRDG